MNMTRTYKKTDSGMIHDGYFITDKNQPLKWVSLNNIVTVYNGNQYTPEYERATNNDN